MSHTAGFPAEYTPEGPREEMAHEQSLVDGFPEMEMQFRLGKGYLYSNWGIRLASLVDEKVTCEQFSKLAQERIIGPLGMSRTTFDLHIVATYPLCLGHLEENGEFKVFHEIQENPARHAAGGLFSNAVDLCRLARCLLNEGLSDRGVRLLEKSSIDEMKQARGQTSTSAAYGIT